MIIENYFFQFELKTYVVGARITSTRYILMRTHNLHLSLVIRKPAFCICKNKDADQLCGNRTADQRLCFRYTDSTFLYYLYPKFQVSSHLLLLYSPVCVGPGRKPRRPVFSQRGSFNGEVSKIILSLTLDMHQYSSKTSQKNAI